MAATCFGLSGFVFVLLVVLVTQGERRRRLTDVFVEIRTPRETRTFKEIT
jgi:hypothetical protein